MIRRTIEKGTKVWSSVHGFGKFHSFYQNSTGCYAMVRFDELEPLVKIPVNDLTEIE